MNQKINEFILWLETEKSNNPSEVERKAKLNTLIAEYQHESEPLPIIDLSFETNAPVPDPEEEKLTSCPACGCQLKPDCSDCPDCGLSFK